VRRPPAVISITLALIVLILAGCGGGDDDDPTTASPTPDRVEAPEEAAPPADAPSDLPPEFVDCMADQGYDIGSSAEIHSAPQEALQACFSSLHGSAGP
jgi:hypothetical protein